jgi:sugar diacid utilization regulator
MRMTRVVEETREIPPERSGLDQGSYKDAIRAFAEIAHAIRAESDLEPLLYAVADKICGLLGISRCSIYLSDESTGLFRGQVSAVPNNAALARDVIKRLVCGGEGDRFTAEILSTKEPVLIPNAKTDPRPNHTIMTDWNVHTMLGVPMIFGQQVIGLMFLDNEDVAHRYVPEEQNLAATFANLAAIAIAQVRVTEALRSNLETIARQKNQLVRSAVIEDRLTNLVLKGAGLSEIADAVSGLTGKPVSIHDARHRRLAGATPEGVPEPPRLLDPKIREIPAIAEALTTIGDQSPVTIGPFLREGVPFRFLLSPIRVRNEHWGYVVLTESPGRFKTTDGMVTRRAATIVALELSAEERAAAGQLHARDVLTRDLISASDDEGSLARRAQFHGLQLDQPHVVCLLADADGVSSRLPSRAIFADLLAPGSEVFATRVAEGLVAALELPEDRPPRVAIRQMRDRLASALVAGGWTDSVIAGLSTPCRGVREFSRAYIEARQVAQCLEIFREGTSRALSADDLGPGRLFLAASSHEDAGRFAMDTLGSLLDMQDSGRAELLRTLAVFFGSSRSIRQSAIALGVHENTIRYRLSRIAEVTGHDVAGDADDQLACQVALVILRLQGRLAVPSE